MSEEESRSTNRATERPGLLEDYTNIEHVMINVG